MPILQEDCLMKFNLGNRVRVIGYGHNIFNHDKDTDTWYVKDMLPNIVGKEGVVSDRITTQNIPQYAIIGIEGKSSWYDERQLQLVK